MDMVYDTTRMYCMAPAPKKRPLDEFIRMYAWTGETKYFDAFLHHYEPALNRRAMGYCRNYRVEHLYPDVKQTIVMTLFEYAKRYDPTEGVPFLQYTRLMVREAVHDLIRQIGGVHSIANASHYRRIRKVNFLHYANLDLGLSVSASIAIIAEQLQITEKKVSALIAEGECFLGFGNLAERTGDSSDEDAPERYERYDRGDKSADPGEVVPVKQREILYRSCGIRCMACGRAGNREAYADIANEFELYSESAVEKIRKEAIRIVREKTKIIE